MEYENLSAKECFKKLNSSEEGLTEEEVKRRLKKYGLNELKERKTIIPSKILLRQFKNFTVWVLLAAALISLFIGEFLSFWTILFVVGFVIFLGFVQEYKAERAMEALKKSVKQKTRVLRNNKIKEVLTKEVVPGDILFLETGDKVPADAKLFDIIGLKVDESLLTGESEAVEKNKLDLIFAGTQIVHGRCKALVLKTGMQTKLGEIASLIQETEEKTPLQIKISQLAKILAAIALITCILTFTLGLFKGAPTGEILIIALALAVASVPEGLPLTLTLTLAYGMHRMANHNAIIRKMLGVEILGSTTVICTDKTGTITRNEITVEKIFTNNKTYDVTGDGYEPKGDFFVENRKVDLGKEETLKSLLMSSALCNNSSLEEKKGRWSIVGDPTEAALVVAAAKANLWKDDLERDYKRVEEIIFTSERKLMTVIYQKGRKKVAFVKGAPEIVLRKCKHIEKSGKVRKISKVDRDKILKMNRNFAGSSLRVLCIAYKNISGSLTVENVEENLTFLGLVAMRDPPKEGVKDAVKRCKSAGVKVVMITGDNEETAKAISKDIGIYPSVSEKNLKKVKNKKLRKIISDSMMTGEELNKLDDREFESIVEDIYVYARIMPEQKIRIVKALKKKGHIVAMTGDGVNDAPALKKADIGVAMGIKGTDVAKESSTMILQDDNFSTIVEAVKQGRATYENIEKFTSYLISRNFTEVILILLSIGFLGFEYLPLLALQILFINIVGEEFPAVSLGLDSARKNIMLNPPKKPKQGILTRKNMSLVFGLATFMTLAAFAVFIFSGPGIDLEKARTATFAAIIGMVIFNTLNFRSLQESIFKTGLLPNRWLALAIITTIFSTLAVMYIPFFRKILEFAVLTPIEWILPLSAAFSTLIFAEVLKIFLNKLMPN